MKTYIIVYTNKKSGKRFEVRFTCADSNAAFKQWRKLTRTTTCKLISITEITTK